GIDLVGAGAGHRGVPVLARVRGARSGRPGMSGARPGESVVVNHREVVRDTAEFGLRRMVGAMAAILPLAGLIQVLANRSDYRQPAVAAGVWLAVFGVGVWLVPRMRRDGLTLSEAAAGILIAVGAVAVIGWEHRAHHPSESVDL